MKKNFKIISSIALAGVLATNAMGATSMAATTENQTKTETVGVYKKLISGKTVIPFVLKDKKDRVTIQDIKESTKLNLTKFNGLAVPAENTVVGTGDTFTAAGVEYTVVVYGDVNGDGAINGIDALNVEKHKVGLEQLDAVAQEAADVKNDASINGLDSLAIKKYVVGLTDQVIDKLPEKEETIDSNYSIEVGNINNQNQGNLSVKLHLAKTLEKVETGYKIKVGGKNPNGEKTVVEKTIDIEAHKDLIEVSNLNVKGLVDGTITITLEDKAGNVKTKIEATKNTITPNSTNITTKRTSTKEATLSLEKCGASNITKVHYLVQKLDEPTPTDIKQLTGKIEVSNNTITDAIIKTDAETATAYKVSYVLENEYGSMSEIKTEIIARDDASVKAEQKIKEVKVPEIDKTQKAEFTWEAKTGKTYAITLYKDGNAVKTTEVTEGKVDFTQDMQGVGKYKVSVFVKGAQDGSTTKSEATESQEVEVSKLQAVSDVKVENEKGNKVKLTWKNSVAKDAFKNYKIDLYTINEKGEEVFNQTIPAPENDKTEVEFTISSNTMYVAKVSLVAKDGQMAVLSSEATKSQEFYIVSAPQITENTDIGTNYVTLSVAPIQINNKKVSYRVKVYDVKEDNDQTEARYTLNTTKDVEVKEGKMTIDGLNPTKAYAFKIVATIDGNEVESAYSEEIKTLPEIKDVTVTKKVAEAQKENAKKVAVDGNRIIINGYTLERDNYTGVTSDKIDDQIEIIDALKEGDKVTISEDTKAIEVELDGGASATDNVRDFSAPDFRQTTITIKSNKFDKTILGNFKEIRLEGTESIFTLDGANATKIVLTDGVEVKGDKTYTVKENANVIINKVKVTTQKETTINAVGKSLTVTANKEANNLVFENVTNGDTTIEFVGEEDLTSKQTGTIKIKSTGGKVTVTQTNVNVSSKLDIEVKNGEVDIHNPALTGDKNITVSKDAKTTITAVAKTVAPINLTNQELKDYTDDEIKALGATTQEEIAKVREYINAFGINRAGAKITVTKGSNQITIVFEKAVENANIANIK